MKVHGRRRPAFPDTQDRRGLCILFIVDRFILAKGTVYSKGESEHGRASTE